MGRFKSFDQFLNLFPAKPRQRIQNGFNVICPCHNDHIPSLSISLNGDNTKILLDCKAGCNTKDILKAKGLTEVDLFLDNKQSLATKPLATFVYQNLDGSPRYIIKRFPNLSGGAKDFRAYMPDGTLGIGKTPRILYNAPEVIKAKDRRETVWVVEGEKDVETLRCAGLVATTPPFGASSEWLPEYTDLLKGANVVIVPDTDLPGLKKAKAIAIALPCSVSSLKLLELQGAKDVTDWLDAGNTVEFLIELANRQPEYAPLPEATARTFNREHYLETLSQWLYIEDLEAIDTIMATALSIYLPGDPVWLAVVAPPGGTKTELLRSFSGERIFSLSTLTPQTLISGLKGSANIDLLPRLDGKVLIIKDFTSILSKKNEDQTAIFADLREAYDGYLEKSFGSGVGTKRYHSKFGLIAGVTGAIDMYRVVHSLLGERFLKCRLRNTAEAAINRAGDLAGKEEKMRTALAEATKGCLAYYATLAKERDTIIVEKKTRDQIKALANITANLRSEVARDRWHKVQYQPQAEVGTRLTKQFLKLAQGLAIFYQHDSIGEDEYKVLLRIAQDTVPNQRMRLVLAMAGADLLSTKEAGDRAKIPTETAKEILEDLWMLKLVDRSGEAIFSWQLTNNINNLLQQARLALGTQNTLRAHRNNNNGFS